MLTLYPRCHRHRAGVTLGLPHPMTQRLGGAPDLVSHRPHRGPLRVVLVLIGAGARRAAGHLHVRYARGPGMPEPRYERPDERPIGILIPGDRPNVPPPPNPLRTPERTHDRDRDRDRDFGPSR